MAESPENERSRDWPGLSAGEVVESRRQNGANELTPPPRQPWYALYLEKFNDPIIRILLVAAVIALAVGLMEGHYAEGVGIIIAILLATTLAFANEYKAGREFDLLNRVSDDVPVRVHRDGKNAVVARRELVVGDIILLENGEEVPADARVLEAVSLLVNESSLTGESVPVDKYPDDAPAADNAAAPAAAGGKEGGKGKCDERHSYPPHRLLRGTLIADGHGLARVEAVGDASEIGRTARAASESTETTTPLKRQLEGLSRVIGVVGFAMAALVFATLVVRGAMANTLAPRQLVPAADPERAAVAITALFSDDAPAFQAAGADAATPTIHALAVESSDPDALSGDGYFLATRKGRRFVRLERVGEQARGNPVTLRYDVQKSPLTDSEWYAFAMLLAFGLCALAPIWLPIAFDALEFAGRRRPAPRWLAAGGGRPWALAAGAGAVLFLLLLWAGRAAGALEGPPGSWMPLATAESFLRIFMIAVTIIVVAVPEGLPMSVTLSLAYAMRRMTATNNLVRRMHACETIGAATVICSDKTGTLTENKMRVAETLFSGDPSAPDAADHPPDVFLAESMAVNATADLGLDDDGHTPVALGNPTEGALLLWLADGGEFDYQKLRGGFSVAKQLPFSTERKFMATSGRSAAAGGRAVLFVKGAPEIVLERCRTLRPPPARPAPGAEAIDNPAPADAPEMSAERRAAWLSAIQSRQARGMRTLGFAYRPLSDNDLSTPPEELARDLAWMGFAAIADPVRAEVPAAIEACRVAGIQVKVVTGDNADTAREIARGIGLWRPEDGDGDERIITGEAFSALDDQAVVGAARRLRIMARARPLAKLRLVKTLQKQGEVVAVTGDGTNDAPALNHADVGLAMGRAGTSTAKEAADIILLDDSFQSIVNAVRWGRSLYANIQKFILFQLTINVAALGIAVLGPFLGVGSPLTVTQMLWVNLIMDTFATLALASEPPNDAVMRAPPRSPGAFIVTPPMRRRIFWMGGLIVAAFIGVVAFGGAVFPLDAATPEGLHNLALFFNAFVFVQFWNLFNARAFQTGRSALARLGESKPFLAIAGLIALGQVLITQFGGELFRMRPLSGAEWAAVIGATSVVLWAGEFERWRERRKAGAL